jgi:UDP-N-acetylmuramyl pentapeptide phosphotransferase/UDP-N-acetylglucosamine-1-phosphate transferase
MTFAAAFFVSLLLVLVIVRSQGRHGRLSHDHDLTGPQKFHAAAVPRIGGVGIFAGVLAAIFLVAVREPLDVDPMLALLACAMPTFLSGVAEDFTKRVPPRWRLVLTALSAVLALLWLGARIERLDVHALRWLLLWPLEAAALTVFVVTGTTNAVNLIDGFNGLASMSVAIMLSAIGFVAWRVHDMLVCELAFAVVGAVLGFFAFNYPRGRIFLGDGGAYFIGFMLVELGLLLLHRNPQVSAMFPLLVCGYPIFETIFTMYRRRFVQRTATGLPDAMHLHHLVFRRVSRRAFDRQGRPRSLAWRNSATSPFLWMVCTCAALPAVCFWNDTYVLLAFIGVFMLGYVALYRRLDPRLERTLSAKAEAPSAELRVAHTLTGTDD